MVVEHVVGARLRGPVGRAHGGAQLGVVVADPLQSAWAESGQGWHKGEHNKMFSSQYNLV